MDHAVSRPPPYIHRNVDAVRNGVHTLARHGPACEIGYDCLAVGDPGRGIARNAAGEEGAKHPLATNDRQVEVRFAPPPRLDHYRLAEPHSCDRRRERMQAAVDDVNDVIVTSIPPQPGEDADGPLQEGIEMPSAQIRGRTQMETPYHDRPLPLSRRRSPLEARREERDGGTAVSQRLRESPRLLLGAAEALREIRRQ